MPLSPDIEKRLDAAKAISDTRERIVAIAHVATSIAKQGDLETALGVTKEIDSSLGPVALVRFRGEGDRIRELVIHDFCKANSPEGRTESDRARNVERAAVGASQISNREQATRAITRTSSRMRDVAPLISDVRIPRKDHDSALDALVASGLNGNAIYDRGRQVDPDELLPFYRSPRARQAAADTLNKRKAKGS